MMQSPPDRRLLRRDESVPSGRATGGRVVRSATSVQPDARVAVREIADALGDSADLYLAFVTADYDLVAAGEALTAWAGSKVVACTSAGGIDAQGYRRQGMIAAALTLTDATVTTVPIRPLDDLDQALADVDRSLRAAVARASEPGAPPAFALMLVDGLAQREEAVTEQVNARLNGIPLIGGSAGDDLRFAHTATLLDGAFVPNAATVSIVSTSAPFRRFRVQHHVAGDDVLVVTAATPDERLVHTLNGRRAVEEYARLVGVPPENLTPTVFSTHPLVLRAGGGTWVRSVSRVEPDGSLAFFCTAETGSILRLARALDPVEALSTVFAEVSKQLGTLDGMLVFDCILRRLEFEDLGLDEDLGQLLVERGAVGFSTYGEQYDWVHVNQTMVGIAFGRS